MNKIKFSIIIPVYNTEKYIKKCIKSIIHQTYDNYEAIFINDGSTDKSEKIINKFAKKNSHIKIINQNNAGASEARKRGVNIATGDYILFVDSDDWIKLNTLERCANTINEHNADIIQYGSIFALGPFRRQIRSNSKIIITHDEFMNKYIYGLAGGYGAISRGIVKAYRKELIQKAFQKKTHSLKIWEDGYMNLIAHTDPEAKTIVLSDEQLYYYRRGSGITSNPDEEMQFLECMKSKELIYNLLVEKKVKDTFLQACLSENAGMTEYYLVYKFQRCSNNEKISIIQNTFEIPAVKQVIDYIALHPEWIDDKTRFLSLNPEQCCQYIESKTNNQKISIETKIKLLLHKIF